MAVRDDGILGERAQATVELAVVAPVLLVLALISYNMMVFLSAVARFDRVVPDIVLVHGSSPSSTDAGPAPGSDRSSDVVRAEIERAMEGYDVEIDVESAEGGSADGGGGSSDAGDSDLTMLGLVGALRTFRCTMRYRPLPQGWSIAGVELGAPFELSHVRSVSIDPWRSGVIV